MTSDLINAKVAEAEVTEKEIDSNRELYVNTIIHHPPSTIHLPRPSPTAHLPLPISHHPPAITRPSTTQSKSINIHLYEYE